MHELSRSLNPNKPFIDFNPYPCQLTDMSPKEVSNEIGYRRNGKKQACEPCRKGKLACDHGAPHCGRCLRRKTTTRCIYHPAPMTRNRSSTTILTPQQSSSIATDHDGQLNSPQSTRASTPPIVHSLAVVPANRSCDEGGNAQPVPEVPPQKPVTKRDIFSTWKPGMDQRKEFTQPGRLR